VQSALTGGSAKTLEFAQFHKKPALHLVRSVHLEPASELGIFVREHSIRVLNVAGPSESDEPGIGVFVTGVLTKLYFR